MSITLRPSIALAAAFLSLAVAAPSAGASGRDLWIECRDTGTVGTNHSPQDYADAIAGAVADSAEYTGCLAAIKAAQTQAALGTSGQPGKSADRDGKGDGRKTSGGEHPAPSSSSPATPASAATGGGVTPAALSDALAAEQLDPSDYPGTGDAASTASGTGKPLQLGAVPESSIARSLSLPLPIAALAIVGLLWTLQLAGRIATRVRS